MHSLTSTRSRTRAVYGVALVITVLLGLASRHDPGGIPEFLGKYPGDALWAMMVFFGWGALRPKLSTLSVAVVALATCWTVEALKLYQAPWVVDLRHTMIGHLVLGHVFSADNLVAYAVGVVAALGVEVLWFRDRHERVLKGDPH